MFKTPKTNITYSVPFVNSYNIEGWRPSHGHVSRWGANSHEDPAGATEEVGLLLLLCVQRRFLSLHDGRGDGVIQVAQPALVDRVEAGVLYV